MRCDGTDDGTEVAQGGDPSDPADGGQPPNTTDVTLSIASLNTNAVYTLTLSAGITNHVVMSSGIETVSNCFSLVKGTSYALSLVQTGSANCGDSVLGYVASVTGGGLCIEDPDSILGNHWGSLFVQSPATGAVHAVKLEVDRIVFNHDSATATDDALNLREDYLTPLPLPEYVKGERNRPAAYIRNTPVSILVRFKAAPAAITSLKIKGNADAGAESLGSTPEKVITFTEGISREGIDDASTPDFDESEYVTFLIAANTPNMICKSEAAWNWMISEINGKAVPDIMGERTSGHAVYVLWDEPKVPWNQTVGHAGNPWIKALEFAIKTAGANEKNDTTALAAITSYLHVGHGLMYDINGGAPACASSNLGGTMDLTGFIDKSSGETINCYDQASGVFSLGRLLGVDVEYRYMDPFGYINTVDLVGEGSCNNPFYPLTTGGKIAGTDDVYPDRSGFGNHAFAKYGGKIYDACVGPYTGIRTEAQYVSDNIDSSIPAEATVAGDIPDINTGLVTGLL